MSIVVISPINISFKVPRDDLSKTQVALIPCVNKVEKKSKRNFAPFAKPPTNSKTPSPKEPIRFSAKPRIGSIPPKDFKAF